MPMARPRTPRLNRPALARTWRTRGVSVLMALCAAMGSAALHAQTPTPGFTLVFAGDTTLDADAGALVARGLDPFQHVAPLLADADVRIANLECVVATVGTPGAKFYTFRAHPRVLPVLRRHFDGVTLANNHSGDYGPQAFAQMLSLLHAHGLGQAGGGMNLAQAHTPWLIERAGLRIAILSYNEFMPRSFEAGEATPGVAWSEDARVIDDIARARRVHRADLVIPFMHWGWENERQANARQRALARRMIDAGADAVIGGHPHVTQEVELYQGKPIVYSVGNFVMKATDNAWQREGWVLRLRFDRAGAAALSTQVIRLDARGIPRPDRQQSSPCWQRGDASPGACVVAPGAVWPQRDPR